MFKHEKQLLKDVRVEKPNPQYAVLMQEQIGGGNGGRNYKFTKWARGKS